MTSLLRITKNEKNLSVNIYKLELKMNFNPNLFILKVSYYAHLQVSIFHPVEQPHTTNHSKSSKSSENSNI